MQYLIHLNSNINVNALSICFTYITGKNMSYFLLLKAPEAAPGLENAEMKDDGNKTALKSLWLREL